MPTAIVTGASRGIGQAIAKEFSSQGWRVLTPSREDLDLASSDAIRRWCDALVVEDVNALVHSAGVNWPLPIGEITDELWATTLQVNLTALQVLVQGLAPHMTNGGRILALSSIFGVVTRPGRAAYSAAKAAVNSLIRTMAVELGPQNILANALCPGYVLTDLTRQNNTTEQLEEIIKTIPLRRLASPQEIAELAVWLCSDKNSYITGQAIVCDGGLTCL